MGVTLPFLPHETKAVMAPMTATFIPSTPRKTKNPHAEIIFSSPVVKKMVDMLTPHLRGVTSVPPTHRDQKAVTYMPSELMSALIAMKRYPCKSKTQSAAAIAVHARREDILCILPTGGGKSLTFQATAATRGGRVIVLVVPFIALAEDQVKSARELGISSEVYHSGMAVDTCPRILCAVVEKATRQHFQHFLSELTANERLHAIVLDEAHLYLSPDLAKFRPRFKDLPGIFVKHNAPLVFLTGSLPPSDEFRLLGLFNRREIRTIRDSCQRRNLSYRVDNEILDWRDPGSVADYICKISKQTCSKLGRVLVFAPSKALIASIKELKGPYGWLRLTAGISPQEQVQTLNSWGSGGSNLILLATSVIGTGVDLGSVRLVIHLGLPSSFRDYFQQSGRAGRDGLPAVAILNPTSPPYVVDVKEEDSVDYSTMVNLATENQCRRLTIDGYMDGSSSICLADDVARCDNCEKIEAHCRKEAGIHDGIVEFTYASVLDPDTPTEVDEEENMWNELGHPGDFFSESPPAEVSQLSTGDKSVVRVSAGVESGTLGNHHHFQSE
jgi:superfamily II DNA helicase RecQ